MGNIQEKCCLDYTSNNSDNQNFHSKSLKFNNSLGSTQSQTKNSSGLQKLAQSLQNSVAIFQKQQAQGDKLHDQNATRIQKQKVEEQAPPKKPTIEMDYNFSDYLQYALEKQKEHERNKLSNNGIKEKKISQHRGKRQIDYLPRRNKLRSVEIDINTLRLPTKAQILKQIMENQKVSHYSQIDLEQILKGNLSAIDQISSDSQQNKCNQIFENNQKDEQRELHVFEKNLDSSSINDFNRALNATTASDTVVNQDYNFTQNEVNSLTNQTQIDIQKDEDLINLIAQSPDALTAASPQIVSNQSNQRLAKTCGLSYSIKAWSSDADLIKTYKQELQEEQLQQQGIEELNESNQQKYEEVFYFDIQEQISIK
eukprot:403377201